MTARKFVWMIGLALLVSGAAIAADQAPQMSPEDQAKMDAAMKLMAPSEAHKVLEPMTGHWKYTSKFWMKPGTEPEVMEGTADHDMVYEGRFLKMVTKGTWMGKPWEGTGYTGYDNVRQEYQSTWIDGMATGIMYSTGSYDAATKTLTLSGTAACPMTGDKNMKMRSEHVITDANSSTFTMYTTGPDGQEFKGMEIVYTRA